MTGPARRITAAVCLATCVACTGGLSRAENQPPRQPTGPAAEPAGRPAARLATVGPGLDLLRDLAHTEGNVLVSPFGISSALLLAWAGAAGETQAGIGRLLEIDPGAPTEKVGSSWATVAESLAQTGPGVQLAVANSIWIRQGLEVHDRYLELAGDTLQATVEQLDFDATEAPERINAWVRRQTSDKIETIVPDPIPPGMVVYLINAIYFKGTWSREFDPSHTHDRPFHPEGGPARDVPMMWAEGRFGHGLVPGAQVLRLPYGSGRFAMYFALPPAGSLTEWLRGLDPEGLDALFHATRDSTGTVVLPRFRLVFETELREPLATRGMHLAFGAGADFSVMTPRGVSLSNVVHKAFLEVNEQGAEAAAVTAAGTEISSQEPEIEFVADHPFFIAIRDDVSGTVLFAGLVRSLG